MPRGCWGTSGWTSSTRCRVPPIRALACATVGVAALLIGCGDDGRTGTCADNVTFKGTTYWAAQSDAPVDLGEPLGTGMKPGCTEGPDGEDHEVTVVRIVGSSPRVEVGVEGDIDSIYQPR